MQEQDTSAEASANFESELIKSFAIGTDGIGFPRKSKTEEVGKASQTILVGECSIAFKTRTFDEPQMVTITAEIDPSKWPPECDVVTPCVYVDAKGMKKEATMRLATWSIDMDDEEGIIVEIMQYVEDIKQWQIVNTQRYVIGRAIEYKSTEFLPTLAVVQRVYAPRYVITPTVYLANEHCIVTLFIDSDLMRDCFLEQIRKRFGKEVRPVTLSALVCNKKDTIMSHIFMYHPEEGYHFVPTGPLGHQIEGVIETANASIRYCELTTNDTKPSSLTLGFKLLRGEDTLQHHAFSHDKFVGKNFRY